MSQMLESAQEAVAAAVSRRASSVNLGNTISRNQHLPSSLLQYDAQFDVNDTAATMRAMDHLYASYFSSFVTDEQNMCVVVRNLAHV